MKTNPHNQEKGDQFVHQLSDHLFWDVDRKAISLEKSKTFLVERILMYGFTADWKLLVKKLGIQEITNTAKKLRYLDDVSLHFIATISETPLNEFRCYTNRPSLSGHWSS